MRVRSWMAALAVIGASSILIGRGLSAQGPGRAQESGPAARAKTPTEKPAAAPRDGEKPESGDRPEKGRDPAPKLPAIQVQLRIAGLAADGCDVEVKPANPSCRFRPLAKTHVSSEGYATIELKDVELRGADRTCSVAITVREPGQPPQTIYRGFRTASVKPGTVPSFTCFISSRLAGVESNTTRK